MNIILKILSWSLLANNIHVVWDHPNNRCLLSLSLKWVGHWGWKNSSHHIHIKCKSWWSRLLVVQCRSVSASPQLDFYNCFKLCLHCRCSITNCIWINALVFNWGGWQLLHIPAFVPEQNAVSRSEENILRVILITLPAAISQRQR